MNAKPVPPSREPVSNEETVSILRRLLLSDGKRHWKGYALAFSFMALMGACTATLAYLMRDAVNAIFIQPTPEAVWLVSGAVMVLSIVKGASAYGQTITMARVGNRIVADNQKRAFNKLMQQDVSYFATRHTAEVSSRFNAGANGARGTLDLVISSIGRDLLSLLMLAGVAIVQDPFLALIALVVMPVAVFGTRKLIRRAKGLFTTGFKSGVKLSSIALEVFQGIRTVKAYTLEPVMRTRTEAYIDGRGAQRQPAGAHPGEIQPAHGDAGRPGHRRRHSLRRLQRDRGGQVAGRVLLGAHRAAARL